MKLLLLLVVLSELILIEAASKLNPLQWAGANCPWFPGPDIFKKGDADTVPEGCEVDQAAYIVRHGSRYPDPSAWDQWVALKNKTSSAKFTATGSLAFLPQWTPVLTHPDQQLSEESITGYRELYTMGTVLRFRYPSFYTDNAPFTVWANLYPRVVDSARLFARGFAGPNATSVVDVIAINSTDPSALANSLAPSDQCPNYVDDSDPEATVFDAVYLPPIVDRVQKLIHGDLVLDADDVSLFPYLCGFETQITGRTSPFCGVFEDNELQDYEYRQDLRYWYGTGPGTDLEQTMMIPLLLEVTKLLQNGPGMTYTGTNGTKFTPPPLLVAFTHDGQINQLSSALGVFDGEKNLTINAVVPDRLFVSSRITPMRGTVALERLNCGRQGLFVRIRLNDAVYPVVSCKSGPGESCPLEQYAQLIQKKSRDAGNFVERCGTKTNFTNVGTTFFTDMDLSSFVHVIP